MPPEIVIVTPKNFNLKLCTRDYIGEDTQHANIGSLVLIGRVAASPHIGEPLRDSLTVLSCPILSFFLGNAPKSNR